MEKGKLTKSATLESNRSRCSLFSEPGKTPDNLKQVSSFLYPSSATSTPFSLSKENGKIEVKVITGDGKKEDNQVLRRFKTGRAGKGKRKTVPLSSLKYYLFSAFPFFVKIRRGHY